MSFLYSSCSEENGNDVASFLLLLLLLVSLVEVERKAAGNLERSAIERGAEVCITCFFTIILEMENGT